MNPARMLSKCLTDLPEMVSSLQAVGQFWAQCSERPRIDAQVVTYWNNLVREWAADSSLALVIRKSSGIRGSVMDHKSGRKLIVADNSPAHWVFSQAYRGRKPKLADVNKMLTNEIPFAYASRNAEQSQVTYRCTLARCDNVNKWDWKLCHTQSVGLRTRMSITEIPIEKLKDHFISLLSPSNHFLVPKRWAGLAEIPEFIEEIKSFEQNARG